MEDTYKSQCESCQNPSNCQWFIDILKHDEIENKKRSPYDYQTLTIVYNCSKYEKK